MNGRDDIAGLGDGNGYFGRRIKTLSCGREAWETVCGSRRDVLTLTRERRIEVYRWLMEKQAQPRWWPGWPGE